MITRIEIDGFKSFLDFALDVPPFLAIAGPNASGKSNLLDALALVADMVVQGPRRALAGQSRGSARDLFHRGEGGLGSHRLTITIGMIVTTEEGPLPTRARLRLRLADERAELEDFTVWVSGQQRRDWMERLKISPGLRDRLARSRTAFLATKASAYIRQDASAEEGWELLAEDQPLWRALVRECRGWRPLVLDPARMREPTEDPGAGLSRTGDNVAAVLHRIDARDELWRIEADLAALVPGAVGVVPLYDERRREYDFDVEFDDTGRVSPKLLSDGTLRILALCAAGYDTDTSGVLMIEEIENGLHPSKVAELVRRMRRGLADLGEEGPPRSDRQLIVTTHSPALVAALVRHDSPGLVFAEAMKRVDGAHRQRSTVTRMLPIRDSGEPGTYASPWDVDRYLSTVRERAR